MLQPAPTAPRPETGQVRPARGAAARGQSAGTWGHADARAARAGERLRRLRYFSGLLGEGLRAARRAGPVPGTLRRERLELGIGLAELDTVALWSTRRATDGAISIPFVEFILAQFVAEFDALRGELGAEGANGAWMEVGRALEEALAGASQGGPEAMTLPRLGDAFLPEPFLAGLCGPGGLLGRALGQCESLLPEVH